MKHQFQQEGETKLLADSRKTVSWRSVVILRPFNQMNCQKSVTDLQLDVPHSPVQGGLCRRPSRSCRSHSRAAYRQARSKGSGRPSTHPGGCRVGNWHAPPRKKHPTRALGCHGCCWQDCRWGQRSNNDEKKKTTSNIKGKGHCSIIKLLPKSEQQ